MRSLALLISKFSFSLDLMCSLTRGLTRGLTKGFVLALFLLPLPQIIVHAQGEKKSNPITVVTSLPVTYGLTSALVESTGIVVKNLPERGRRLGGQSSYFQSRAERMAADFEQSAAVVTIGKIWSEDPLYTAARQANIAVINIDATKPWSFSLEGISVAAEPQQNAKWSAANEEHVATPSAFYWLSLSNAVRSADIIATDLKRLAPEHADAIDDNLQDLRRQLLQLYRDYELKLALLPDLTVYSLAPEFIYLTSEFGLYVDGYFFKQDIDWTESDLASFRGYLNDNDIPVVLHKWQPEPPIVAAIEAAGATLVVLETLDSGVVTEGAMIPESYLQLMEKNLEALYQTLAAANK